MERSQSVKTNLTIFNLLILLSGTFAMTTCFGQVITWTNSSAQTYPGGNFGRSTNWSGNNGIGGTTPITGTTCTFDGTVPGNLIVFSLDGINGAGSGSPIGGG